MFLGNVMKHLRNRHLLLLDFILLPTASYLAFVLRLEAWDIERYWLGWAIFAILATLSTVLTFWRTGVYARFWRYASIDEVVLLAGAMTGGALISGLIGQLLRMWAPWPIYIPRSVPYIFLLLGLGATAGPRLLMRFIARTGGSSRRKQPMTPVAIMGAGEAGSMIVRELLRNPQLGLRVVAFFDDDPAKRRMRLHNIPVVGNRYAIPEAVARYRFRQVIIAMPTAPGREIRDIVGICERAGVTTKIIPGMYELLGGKVQVTQLRNVEIEDLLRREPVTTDIEAVRELVRNKRVLVTGGGGSIGSELSRQIWHFGPAQLVLLGHGENSIFDIYHELLERNRGYGAEGDDTSKNGVDAALVPIIADIRFAEEMQFIFRRHRPDIVFHAAAHKHVPLMEVNPAEAVANNILGTYNLLQAALGTNVSHFVMISTDKAVNPTSVMGATKRVAELLVQQAAMRSGRAYVAVRFGNVLGSRGSVVHTFKRQIAAGGPVTVTHPEMKRYFMTIPEAVQLVLQASVLGKGGEVFVLDMGEPVKIVDLARDLIELSGLEVGRDIEIVFTGPRPGEKLFEELFVDGETYSRTQHQKIYVAIEASRISSIDLDEGIRALAAAARRHDREAIIRLLQSLVPEYRPTEESSSISLPSPEVPALVVESQSPRTAPRASPHRLGDVPTS